MPFPGKRYAVSWHTKGNYVVEWAKGEGRMRAGKPGQMTAPTTFTCMVHTNADGVVAGRASFICSYALLDMALRAASSYNTLCLTSHQTRTRTSWGGLAAYGSR